jgi:lysophospholipase L1-like esterase
MIMSAVMFLTVATIARAQDWPNLEKYQRQNEKLGAPQPGEKRVVLMGNSITEGWKSSDPEFFARSGFINRGIGGQTTPQMLLRFRQDVIALEPSAVVILAGTNDIAGNTGPMTLEQIMDNLKSMTELALSNEIKVILCSVLPAFDYTWRPGLEPNKKIPLLNAMLKEFTTQNDVYYLDYFSAMTDGNNGLPKVYSEDGVHPTLEGYKVMEPMLLEALESLFSIH